MSIQIPGIITWLKDWFYDKTEVDNLITQSGGIIVDSALDSTSSHPVENQAIVSALNNKANDGHNHNDLYYTESEVDDLLIEKSDNGHKHDNRYYTETEVDNLLNGKSDTNHDHDSRYYTETEVNNLLNGKSDTNHSHANRWVEKTCSPGTLLVNEQLRLAQWNSPEGGGTVSISTANNPVTLSGWGFSSTYAPSSAVRMRVSNSENLHVIIDSSGTISFVSAITGNGKPYNGTVTWKYI